MTANYLYQMMKSENDFTPVISTAVRECQVKDEQSANLLLDAFLQWFSLIPLLKEEQKLQMIRGVDPIWHALILNTKFYFELCEKYIGFYVHHDPTDVELEESKEEYANFTLDLLRIEFGDNLNSKLLLLEEGATCCSWKGPEIVNNNCRTKTMSYITSNMTEFA